MSEEVVELEAKAIEEKANIELTLKRRRRDREMLTFLKAAHDREAQKVQVCLWQTGTNGYDNDGDDIPVLCGEGPFETWGELGAHVRRHLIIDSKDEKNIRQVLADGDKLLVPKEDTSVKMKLTAEDRETILERLGMVIPKKLGK